MIQIFAAGFFILAVIGFFYIIMRIKNVARPAKKEKPQGTKVSEEELAEIMIRRVDDDPDDAEAVEWLLSHSYEPV
jgi:uncharacterized membrane protein YciS (DUF1049 family)